MSEKEEKTQCLGSNAEKIHRSGGGFLDHYGGKGRGGVIRPGKVGLDGGGDKFEKNKTNRVGL